MEEPVPAAYRPATPSEMQKGREETERRKEELQPVRTEISDRIEEIGPYLGSDVAKQLANDSVKDKVITEDEAKAILAALVNEDIKLRDYLGPRAVRAFLFRYQLARLILTKHKVSWTPGDLARDLAAKFIISAETANILPPSLHSSDLVNLSRAVEQVSRMRH